MTGYPLFGRSSVCLSASPFLFQATTLLLDSANILLKGWVGSLETLHVMVLSLCVCKFVCLLCCLCPPIRTAEFELFFFPCKKGIKQKIWLTAKDKFDEIIVCVVKSNASYVTMPNKDIL